MMRSRSAARGEASAHQTAQMFSSATSSATTTTVHAVAHSSQQQRRKWNQPRTPPHREEPECPNCGYGEHKAGQSCPAKGQLASNAASGIISAGSASQAEVPDGRGPTQHDHSHGNDISHAQVVHTTLPTEMTREWTATTSKQSLRWDRP